MRHDWSPMLGKNRPNQNCHTFDGVASYEYFYSCSYLLFTPALIVSYTK